LIFSISSSTGGEPESEISGEGSGTDECPVMAEGQSCEMNTSTNGEEQSADMVVERWGEVDGGETALESNFETV